VVAIRAAKWCSPYQAEAAEQGSDTSGRSPSSQQPKKEDVLQSVDMNTPGRSQEAMRQGAALQNLTPPNQPQEQHDPAVQGLQEVRLTQQSNAVANPVSGSQDRKISLYESLKNLW
jgi:hypothetical protein